MLCQQKLGRHICNQRTLCLLNWHLLAWFNFRGKMLAIFRIVDSLHRRCDSPGLQVNKYGWETRYQGLDGLQFILSCLKASLFCFQHMASQTCALMQHGYLLIYFKCICTGGFCIRCRCFLKQLLLPSNFHWFSLLSTSHDQIQEESNCRSLALTTSAWRQL